METLVWISLKNLDDNVKIWTGTKVRLFNVGLNVEEKSDDYYVYMVCDIYGNNDYFQLINLSQGKAGYITCVIKKESPHHYAIGKTLKDMMDLENTFILLE